jgi:hypothetical protein
MNLRSRNGDGKDRLEYQPYPQHSKQDHHGRLRPRKSLNSRPDSIADAIITLLMIIDLAKQRGQSCHVPIFNNIYTIGPYLGVLWFLGDLGLGNDINHLRHVE